MEIISKDFISLSLSRLSDDWSKNLTFFVIFSEISAIEISYKEFMKYHIPVFLVVVHCAICIPIYLLYEIVCDHCIPVSHESKLMANYKLVLGCIQAFVWPSLNRFFNFLIYRRFSLQAPNSSSHWKPQKVSVRVTSMLVTDVGDQMSQRGEPL